MQVLEIIQHKHQKQQLNEALPALLIGAIVTSVGAFALDKGINAIKSYADDLEIKNYKPTGRHIPDQTIITDGKKRYIYDAKEMKWAQQDKVKGRWKFGEPKYTAQVTDDMLKKAIKNKKLTFGNKAAVVKTMQAQFMEKQIAKGNPTAKAAFAKSGNFLDDVIAKEEAKLIKGSGATWNRLEKGAGKIFTARLFQMVNIFMPVALVVNAVRLKAWYKTKLNWGKGGELSDNPLDTIDTGGRVGYPHPTDPDKFYGQAEYNADMIRLRTTTVNAAVGWMSAVGINTIASGIFWIYAQRKGAIVDRAKKKGLARKIINPIIQFLNPGKWVTLGLKWGSRFAAAGLVYSAFDRKFAEKLANAMADFIFEYDPFTGKYSTAEDVTEHMIKALGDTGYEEAMSIVGLGTTAGDNLAKAKDENPLDQVNPLNPGSGSSAGDAFDDISKGDDFWNQ